jgi:hypothetical protein
VDSTDLAKTFGSSILGSLIGIIGAYLKASNRVERLETWKSEFSKAYKEILDKNESERERYKSQVHERFENLGKAWTLALDQRDAEIMDRVSELKRDLKALEDSFQRFMRASHSDFASDDKFSKFVQEMNTQWKAVERTLGHIEGWMKAQPKGLSSFPPTR